MVTFNREYYEGDIVYKGMSQLQVFLNALHNFITVSFIIPPIILWHRKQGRAETTFH